MECVKSECIFTLQKKQIMYTITHSTFTAWNLDLGVIDTYYKAVVLRDGVEVATFVSKDENEANELAEVDLKATVAKIPQ